MAIHYSISAMMAVACTAMLICGTDAAPPPLSPTTGWSLLAWSEASPQDSVLQQQVVVVDMFDTDASEIAAFKADGHTVVCYYSAGTFEDWRDDYTTNKAAWEALAVGNMADWEGEGWLDITKLDDLKTLMTPRLDLAASKGCDGVEPDNTDCFTNQDECPLPSVSKAEQKAAQLAYNTWTAEYAHTKGMLCALKNTGDLAESLAKIHDFAIVEECMKYDECDTYNPFFLEGKPIFGIDYTTLNAAQCKEAVETHHVQMKHCNGNSNKGECVKAPLVNCYTDEEDQASGEGSATGPTGSTEKPAVTADPTDADDVDDCDVNNCEDDCDLPGADDYCSAAVRALIGWAVVGTISAIALF